MPNVKQISDWFGLRPMVGDGLWALFFAPPTVVNCLGIALDHGHHPLVVVLGVLWALGFLVPLLWRRLNPSMACLLLVVPHLAQLVVTGRVMFPNLFVAMLLYAVAAHGGRRAGRVWLSIGVVCSAIAALRWSDDVADGNSYATALVIRFLALVAVVVASWLLGAFNRERHVTVASLRQRAEALERERDRSAQLAAEQERSRIAREMHDIVAHSLSVIVIQTDGARYALDQPGTADDRLTLARSALDTVGQAAREALRETRALVGVLREGDAVDIAPQPQLADLAGLVAAARTSGQPVELTTEGDPGAHLPIVASLQTAVYRIVQESLTNVLKHAGPGARTWVSVRHEAARIVVSVRDDGRGCRHDDGLGHGLIGMRERVAPFGGTLVSRNRLDGGFQVIATLPVTGPGQSPDTSAGGRQS